MLEFTQADNTIKIVLIQSLIPQQKCKLVLKLNVYVRWLIDEAKLKDERKLSVSDIFTRYAANDTPPPKVCNSTFNM